MRQANDQSLRSARGRAGGAGHVRPGRGRRRAALAVATCAALLVAAGCGSSSSNKNASPPQNKASASHPVTITFANWADAETATEPGIKAAVAEFEKTHPGIKIKEQAVAFTDIGHNLVLQVKSGNTPDVAEISGNDTYSVQEAGGLEPLDSFATPSYKSEIIPSELKQGEIDGHLYAIPWADAPPALWYNKTLLAKAGITSPPATITQLLSDLAALKQKEPKVVGLGLDTSNRDFGLESNWTWMKTFGATPFTGSKATADTAAMKSYLTFMRNVKSYIQPLQKIGTERPLAADNELAFTWDQPLLQGVIQSDNKNLTDAEFYKTWGVAPLPTGPTGKSSTIELGHQLVMFKNSKNQAADWEFMNWLSTSDWAVQNYTIKYESSLPPLAHPSTAVSRALKTPVYEAFEKATSQIVIPSYGATFEEGYPPIMAGIQQAVTSKTPVDKIASSMQTGLENAFR